MKAYWLGVIATVIAFDSPQLNSSDSPEPIALEVNIPAFRLDVIRAGEVIGSYEVAVGMRKYSTPTGTFSADRVIWNPWWYPPKSYWARHEKITPPGPSNPMGKVKISFGGPLYAHGTPLPLSIGSAASHGCIRMRGEDAVSLAIWLEDEVRARVTPSQLESLLAGWDSTYEVTFPTQVPVRVVYELAEMKGDTLLLHPDIYRWGTNSESAILAVLSHAGIDTAGIDRPAVRKALRGSRTSHVRISAHELLKATHE